MLFGWSPVDERLRVVAEQDLNPGLGSALERDIEDFFDPDAGLAENGHTVYRVRRAGAAGEPFVVDELFYDRLPSINDAACASDFNNDGTVDFGDFGAFVVAFDTVIGDEAYEPDADFDADGDVDFGDFGFFVTQFDRDDCAP